MAVISLFAIAPLFLSLLVVSGRADFIKTGLLPKLEKSFALSNDCDSVKFKKKWVDSCTFATDGSSLRVALVGDSHAGAASDAVFEVVNDFGGELLLAPASSCPFLLGLDLDDSNCEQLNEDRAIAIAKYKPQVVYMANDYIFMVGRKTVDLSDVAIHFTQTLQWLADIGIVTIVQGQVPTCDYEISMFNKFVNKSTRCLNRELSKSGASEISEVLRLIAGRFANVEFVDPLPLVCPEVECVPFVGQMSIFEGRTHLTVTANKLLKPKIEEVVRKLISPVAD